MSHQPPLRILTVAPQREGALPSRENGVPSSVDATPLPGGGWLIPEGLSAEDRRELHRAAYRASLRDAPHETTARTEEARRASMRATLNALGRRSGDTALHVAGRLYVAHGDRARAVLATTREVWGPAAERIDEHLARAGLEDWRLL